MNSSINKSKGNKAKAWFSLMTRAGLVAALVMMLSSSLMATNIFRYTKVASMDKDQTHYYNVILSDETTAGTHIFTFDFESLKSNEMTLTLPDGEVIQPRKIVMPNSGYGSRTMWVGRFGQNGEIHLAPHFKDQMLTGHITTDTKTYAIRSLTGGVQVLIEYDDFGLETCGNGKTQNNVDHLNTVPHIPSHEDEFQSDNPTQGENKSVVLNDECYIRVLVGYTTTVAANEADPLGLIMTAISLSNTGYANSGIDQEVQLVRVYNTGYNDAGLDQGDVLDFWRITNDGIMDDVHSERNLYDADMCALITNIGSGVAYVSINAAFSFSLTNRTRVSGFTFHHELGHNHACYHDPANNSTGPGSDYEGYGNPSGYFRTVMAYQSACGTGPGTCARVNEFSGPSNFYFHAPTSSSYVTGNAGQNNVLGHNTNNGTVVDHRVMPNNIFFAGDYDFQEFEFINLSGEVSARYNSSVNQMIFQSGSEGSFSAGDSIILGRGFEVKAGAVFTAYLEPTCTSISLDEGTVETLIDGNETLENDAQVANTLSNHAHDGHTHLGVDGIHVYPNPFDEVTNIEYHVAEAGPVTIQVFDINGRVVNTLVNTQNHTEGTHKVVLNGNDLSTGIYHCKMTTKNNVKVIALSLSK